MRFRRGERVMDEIVNRSFPQRELELEVNPRCAHGSTPVFVKSLALAEKLQRGFAFLVGESVARNVARIRLLEKISVIHRHALGLRQLVGMALPFRVMMGDVT